MAPIHCPKFSSQRSSPHIAGDLNIPNYTILNTFMFDTRKLWLFSACPDALTPLSLMNSMLQKIQLTTWMCLPTLKTLKTLHTHWFNHHHILFWTEKHTPVAAFCWAFRSLSHWNTTFRVTLNPTYNTIHTTELQYVNSTNINSLGSRGRERRNTTSMWWRKKILLCMSKPSEMGMASSRYWLACVIMRLSGSGNYTLSTIWDWMTITNALSDTWVETCSNVYDGWYGSQPIPTISYTHLNSALIPIRHRIVSIPTCALWTGGGKHREGEILEDNIVLIELSQCSECRIHWFPWPVCSTEYISWILLLTRQGSKYKWQLALYLRRYARYPPCTAL